MNIFELFSAQWAITPAGLNDILSAAGKLFNKLPRNELEVDESLTINVANTPINAEGLDVEPQFHIVNNVAIVPVKGPLVKNPHWILSWLGMSSMKEIGMAFDMAMMDSGVRAVMLHVDSRGGSVDGTFDLAEKIYSQRGIKPIVALSDGVMDSAAYAIGSAADKVYITGSTVEVGSVGVIASHQDFSKAEEMMGIKVTEITAGRYKAVGSPHKPLDDFSLNTLQDKLDYLYGIFIETMVKHRGLNNDAESIASWADGRTFLGEQGIEVGLVDGIMKFDELLESLASNDSMELGMQNQASKEVVSMDLAKFKTDHPELYAQVFALGNKEGEDAGLEVATDAASTAAATAENERVMGVYDRGKRFAGMGLDEKVEEFMKDGKTTPEAAADELSKIALETEGFKKAEAQQSLQTDPGKGIDGSSSDGGDSEDAQRKALSAGILAGMQ